MKAEGAKKIAPVTGQRRLQIYATDVRETFGSSEETKQLGAASRIKMESYKKTKTVATLHEFNETEENTAFSFYSPQG